MLTYENLRDRYITLQCGCGIVKIHFRSNPRWQTAPKFFNFKSLLYITH